MLKLWLNTLRVTRPDMLTQGPNEREQRIVGEHFAYWQGLTQQGIALLVGRTQDAGPQTIGLAIFAAPDEASAIALCQADPTVANDVMGSTVQPYRIALLADEAHFAAHR
ncbi:MAG: YciI family protein [Anaerolineae bacterium]|nr:YciI family protein [Anaerolineae bacterium]